MSSLENLPINYREYYSLINVFEQQAKKYANDVYIRYYGRLPNGGRGYKTLTYAEVDRVATNLACQWKNVVKGHSVVGFIADHSVQYFICVLALLKLRTVFLSLSPRNSEAAVVNLLTNTNCRIVFSTSKYAALANGAAGQLSGITCEILPPFDLNNRLRESLNPLANETLDKNFSEEDLEKPAAILHSSGSTAFPKPIPVSNKYLISGIQIFPQHRAHLDPTAAPSKDKVQLCCLPIYHISGFMASFTMCTFGASNVFLPKLPPSAREILNALYENKCTCMLTPPLLLDQLIPSLKTAADWAHLQKLQYIVSIGAELNEKTGDFFQKNQVNICNAYGMTEIGFVMVSDFRKQKSTKWNLVQPYEPLKEYFLWEPVKNEPNQRVLVLHKNHPTLATGVSNRPDGGYITNDIFRETFEGSGLWRYLGRQDDTLAMKNGEKTNPVPMESAIRSSPAVKFCTVIGEGRECTAALVELDKDIAFNLTPQQMIDEVHTTVDKANVNAPSHSHLMKQMVHILPFNSHLPHTDKGTVPRKRAILMYNDVIEKMYDDFVNGPKDSQPAKRQRMSPWTPSDIEDFISRAAASILPNKDFKFYLKDVTTSLFDLGLNSLLSIQLRNRIALSFGNVPQNFLFEHPSIEAIRDALMGELNESQEDMVVKRYMETENILDKYLRMAKTDFEVCKTDYPKHRKQVVLLTGATGAVGSFILRDLLQSPDVKKVYCLVRGRAGTNLMSRLRDAFVDRCLDISLLESDRVEALPMDLNDEYLGFEKGVYESLRREVTVVQACAWLLDFNQPVAHYDKECLIGFYNLIKFAYKKTNPMHFHHVSSITATAKYGAIIPEIPVPRGHNIALPMGYGQSKYVCEHLMTYLSEEKNFPCYIERLGQVCGDSVNGAWNTSEQFPTMIVTGATFMHKMPRIDTRIDWIPLNYAASSIARAMLLTANDNADAQNSVYHIVNPHEVHWSDILSAMKSCGMEFEVVSVEEWIRDLSENQNNPCFKFMSFYESAFKDLLNTPHWNTEKTVSEIPIIGECPSFNHTLLSKYINYWKKEGFYN